MTQYTTFFTLSGLLVLASLAQAQTPSFAPVATYSTGASSYPDGVAVADVNGDGKPDLLTANDAISGKIGVLLGTGTGTFGTATTYPLSMPSDIMAADVNGDGRPDILATSYDTNVVGVLLSTGTSTFGTMQAYGTGTNSHPESLAIADVNSDGKPDIITANYNSNTVGVLLGTGTGSFGSVVTYPTGTFSLPMGVAVADVNGDGRPDIAVASSGSGTAGVLLGTGGGAFGAVTAYNLGASSSLFGVALADVNGDGKPDLIAANEGTSTVGILLGTGTGTFGAVTAFSTGRDSRPHNVVVADVNGDGKRDLVVANYYNGTVGVLPGIGNGTFGAVASYRTGPAGGPWSATVADVNGDGKPDLISANYDTHTAGVFLNTTVVLATHATLPGTTATLHPNPASTYATLSLAGLPGAVAQVQTALLDATGRAVRQQALAAHPGTTHLMLPTTGLATGFYVLRLTAYDSQGQLVGSLPTQRLSVR
ncbi:MAG: FG-GAP-like repeat-containing protein [Janthinobacterium lividum]